MTAATDATGYKRRIMGIETEYGVLASALPGQRVLSPDETARELFSPVVEKYQSSNIFVDNASRLYLDVGSHPEIATGECDSLAQLLNYERAGDAIMDRLAHKAEQRLRDKGLVNGIYLFKNNVDSQGNSYGNHENYLVSRQSVLKEVGKALLPFMITRQLLCGAGLVRPSSGDKPAQFLLSQRADQVWDGVSSATTRSRPIINTRDEPHADSHLFRRMHVIVGDSNMAEPTFALKIGSTLLVLEMLESGFEFPHFQVVDPIRAIRDIARDQTGGALVELEDGSTATALEIQQEIFMAARRWTQTRDDTDPNQGDFCKIIDLWRRILEAIETQDFSDVDTEIDWVIKKKILDQYRDRLDCTWDHPKLAQVDLTFHDIRAGRGLYDALVRRGLITRWTTDEDIHACTATPPATTRARLRGEFLRQAGIHEASVTVDWTRFKVNRPEPLVYEFNDPFTSHDERLQEMVEYMATHSQQQY